MSGSGPPPDPVPGGPRTPLRAVCLDAMGTLVRLEDPVGGLREALARRGATVDDAQAAVALRAEIAVYRAHHLEGSDAAGLAALRDRCAAALADALPPGTALPRADVRGALLEALRFVALPGAADALRELRALGLRTVACSNWDVSLHDALAAAGLAPLLDGALSSAEVGAAKPDPAPLRAALRLLGVPPDAAVHVGDDAHADVGAARACGVRAVLVGGVNGLEAAPHADASGPTPIADAPRGAPTADLAGVTRIVDVRALPALLAPAVA